MHHLHSITTPIKDSLHRMPIPRYTEPLSMSEDAQVAPKNASLDPVEEYEHPVPRADLHEACVVLCVGHDFLPHPRTTMAGPRSAITIPFCNSIWSSPARSCAADWAHSHSCTRGNAEAAVYSKHGESRYLLGHVDTAPEQEADIACKIEDCLPSFQLSHGFVATCMQKRGPSPSAA